MAKLYLVRHGESVANTEGIYQGQTYDTDLTENGKKQAELVAKALAQMSIIAVYSGPLKRAFQTAVEIAKPHNLKVSQTKDMIEMSHGLWEGHTKEWVDENYHDMLNVWHHNPSLAHMPQGESCQDVLMRAKSFLNHIKDSAGDVVCVSHDVVIKLLIVSLLEAPIDDIVKIELDNCGISIIDLTAMKIEAVNNKLHLASLTTDYGQQAL
jgi:broad specificity phosphatase PhoE